ncbi:lymphatic vessel endothelial hyaluronic acid receptor 1a [Pundamilia nyererei]|uniref:Lymphatic vessel endothelial hyaluronan receptor 1 n=1 Tax=Pundamilia nyererei TaxID=303518 RepID=A0A3B4FR98_9CICH|nr:PREDICTED: lymphatic vessel endothelial hyaluronic acid receptor 1 [Pundamilia nyererei]
MNIIWLCLPAALLVTSALSVQMTDIRNLRVSPGFNQSIAGVMLVTSLNELNQPEYAFNASEARRLCWSLGLNIASKAQVQKALSRGLETCRFGWIDEHFAVIPRIHPIPSCGRNKSGLVPWRASVKQKFDVFCFNETDAAIQRMDEVTDSPLKSTHGVGHTHHTTTPPSTSSSSTPETLDSEIEPARFASSSQSFTAGKAVLIFCSCALLLLITIILTYLKLRRCSQKSDVKEQKEYIQTEEWICVKTPTETKKAAEEDERIEVGDDAQ